MGLHVPFASYVLAFFPSIISLLMIIYFLYCFFFFGLFFMFKEYYSCEENSQHFHAKPQHWFCSVSLANF